MSDNCKAKGVKSFGVDCYKKLRIFKRWLQCGESGVEKDERLETKEQFDNEVEIENFV